MDAIAALTRRRLAALVLPAGVAVVHLWVVQVVADASRIGEGAADSAPRRIDVAFVRELAPVAPPPAPPPAQRKVPRRAQPQPAEAAASAPVQEPMPEPPVSPAAAPVLAEPAPMPEPAASAVTSVAAATAVDPASAASAMVSSFEWPPSTRLSYTLTGYYRGPVEGSAQVEWLRQGGRYQVHLDVRIGPSFAPLVSRRMSSDGNLTEQGLKPQRYDEETKVLLREPRRQAITFEANRIVLPRGLERPMLAGVQDTASQFVQLTWLFTTQPQRLRAGESIEVPLALPRHVSLWYYDVMGEELLYTPVGTIPTFYVRPRREAGTGGDLVVEAWFAPSLQYLPVRIRIRQDAETSVDLLLERLPQQSATPPR